MAAPAAAPPLGRIGWRRRGFRRRDSGNLAPATAREEEERTEIALSLSSLTADRALDLGILVANYQNALHAITKGRLPSGANW